MRVRVPPSAPAPAEGGDMSDKAFTPRADRATLMREHAAARAQRAAAPAGSPEWRAAAAEVAAIEVELAKFEALRVPPARIARPEAKGK
jgi:hypothetical protein